MTEKQAEAFDRDYTAVEIARPGLESEWGETPEAVAQQDNLGAVTPDMGFVDG